VLKEIKAEVALPVADQAAAQSGRVAARRRR
jgi:hypothetical protein